MERVNLKNNLNNLIVYYPFLNFDSNLMVIKCIIFLNAYTRESLWSHPLRKRNILLAQTRHPLSHNTCLGGHRLNQTRPLCLWRSALLDRGCLSCHNVAHVGRTPIVNLWGWRDVPNCYRKCGNLGFSLVQKGCETLLWRLCAVKNYSVCFPSIFSWGKAYW